MEPAFIDEMQTLLLKHDVYLEGELRLRPGHNARGGSQKICRDEIKIRQAGVGHPITDRSGPFLTFGFDVMPPEAPTIYDRSTPPHWAGMHDRDYLLRDGVKSPSDGRIYSNRREWNDHLKARGLVEVGNDWNNQHFKQPEINYSPREMQEVHRATAAAVDEVFDKRRIRA